MQVVDTVGCEGRQKMFDSGNADILDTEDCGQTCVDNVFGARGDINRSVACSSVEEEAGTRFSGAQGHVDTLAAMQADAGDGDRFDNSLLTNHNIVEGASQNFVDYKRREVKKQESCQFYLLFKLLKHKAFMF